jgi:hypothetical protein
MARFNTLNRWRRLATPRGAPLQLSREQVAAILGKQNSESALVTKHRDKKLESFLQRQAKAKDYVFFARPSGARGPILVRESDSPTYDLNQIDPASPVPLTLIGSVPAKEYPLRWWRKTLEPFHQREDWYTASEQVLCYIDDAVHGRLDPVPYAFDIPTTIPEHLRTIDEERLIAAAKWAFPEPDPYPTPPTAHDPIPPSKAKNTVLKAIASAKAKHPLPNDNNKTQAA